jgi:Methylase involved in ubiquinone/menaquinone biosynthesis
MQYNEEFWKKYADENESRYNEEFSKYVRDLASSLPGVQSILEIGCGTGIDLRLFSDSFQLHGIDLNEHALEIAKEKLSSANFQKGDITKLPCEDSSIDLYLHMD